MAIEREPDYSIVIVCDGLSCPEVLRTETTTWMTAMNLMKRNGWINVRHLGTWLHYCKDCAAERGG